MRARFIAKTHTEALRPGNYSILISKCTSPDQGAYPEQVEKRLQEFTSNNSVAKFTVLTATTRNRGFEFLHNNMIWSWKGHVINCALIYLNKNTSNEIANFYKLTRLERIMFFRFFIETEGSLILKLAVCFTKMDTVSYSYLKENIQNIFNEIYDEYIDIAPDFRTRHRIIEAQKQLMDRHEKYDPGTLAHKIKPHIQALSDLGLIKIEQIEKDEVFRIVEYGNISPFEMINQIAENFTKLEEIVQKDDYYYLIARAFNLNPITYSYPSHANPLKESLKFGYDHMSDNITGMTDIEALITWTRVHLLSELNILMSRENIEDYFREMRKIDPSSIRYHLDGKGNIAYMIINNWI